MRITVVALALLSLAWPVTAQDDPEPARIRHVVGDVTLQRATEAEAEPAVPNLIWLGGDRLWTTAGGRAELQMPDGSLIHLATSSKLDLIGYDGTAFALRLWAGSLNLWIPSAQERPDIVVETPDAVVSVREPGLYRIDAITGETRLSVHRGAATLEAGGEQLALGEGERSWARAGEPPDRPAWLEAQGDAFDTWVDARLQLPRHGLPGGVPEEIAPWAGELSEYGEWSELPEVGTVWRPRAVAVGWQPYQAGRWAWSPWGWTWVSYEPWGWAPYHYGRWGFSVSLGWYWSPGRTWGPAWVSWSIGGGYVGWCPLGLGGGPVFPHHRFGRGSRGWVYVDYRGLGSRHLDRHRVAHSRLGGVHFTHLRRGLQPDRRGRQGVARRAVPRGDRSVFGRLDRGTARTDGLSTRPANRTRGGSALGRSGRVDERRLSSPTRDRGDGNRAVDPRAQRRDGARSAPARDRARFDRTRPSVDSRSYRARPEASSRDRTGGSSRARPEASSRARTGASSRSRPATRDRSGTTRREFSSGASRSSRPAARERGGSRDRSVGSRSGVAPRSRPAARERSRPATRSGSVGSRSGVPSRTRPAARERSRPTREMRSAPAPRSERPAARSSRPARDRSGAASRDRGAQRSGAARSGRSRDRKQRQH